MIAAVASLELLVCECRLNGDALDAEREVDVQVGVTENYAVAGDAVL